MYVVVIVLLYYTTDGDIIFKSKQIKQNLNYIKFNI